MNEASNYLSFYRATMFLWNRKQSFFQKRYIGKHEYHRENSDVALKMRDYLRKTFSLHLIGSFSCDTHTHTGPHPGHSGCLWSRCCSNRFPSRSRRWRCSYTHTAAGSRNQTSQVDTLESHTYTHTHKDIRDCVKSWLRWKSTMQKGQQNCWCYVDI